MTKLLGFLALSASVAFLSGCATSPDPCAGWKPIRPASTSAVKGVGDVDVISGSLTDQILAHNTFGMKQCGWTP